MDATQKIQQGEWIKFFSLKLTLLSGSMLGEMFTKTIASKHGEYVDNFALVSKNGFSTAFLRVEDRKRFSKQLVRKYVVNSSAKGISEKLMAKAESIKALSNTLLNKEFISEDFEKVIESFKLFIEAYDDYNKFHVIPKQLIDYVSQDIVEKVIGDLREARLASEPVHALADKVIQKFAEKIAAEKNKENKAGKIRYTAESIVCMTKPELDIYFAERNLPASKELASRQKSAALVITRKESIVTTDETQISKIELLNVKPMKDGEVKGNIAFKGKVIGKARIVYDPTESKEFSKGDILITGMTRPEYVPLMEKAAAIVTDSGGLLCHAAIVARELGKPCIIGTQFATKMFRDGDLIEVDANIGIVRKIG